MWSVLCGVCESEASEERSKKKRKMDGFGKSDFKNRDVGTERTVSEFLLIRAGLSGLSF